MKTGKWTRFQFRALPFFFTGDAISVFNLGKA
jgi:hypothetical protein